MWFVGLGVCSLVESFVGELIGSQVELDYNSVNVGSNVDASIGARLIEGISVIPVGFIVRVSVGLSLGVIQGIFVGCIVQWDQKRKCQRMNGICVKWCNFNERSQIGKNGIRKNLAVRPVKISSCLEVNFFFWYKPSIVMINLLNFGTKEKSMMLMSKRTPIYVTFYE